MQGYLRNKEHASITASANPGNPEAGPFLVLTLGSAEFFLQPIEAKCLALSLWNATRDLDLLVEAQRHGTAVAGCVDHPSA